ncbi:hypothetical protein KJR58_24470, partial [Escherichia coli]|nr:hypothetical protein [Escherichia coli]
SIFFFLYFDTIIDYFFFFFFFLKQKAALGFGVSVVGSEMGIRDRLKQLERVKLGFVATPAPGDLTLGGVLAIDGHGTGIPAQGESRLPGQSYGSPSNSTVAVPYTHLTLPTTYLC